ncbi:MAG: GNAT family N-acetyltransferase [Candidatus Thiosymbion ectosymbiont of Robbea hypermnestra]|nr:GNAT family N-acetyltransferase [Candidatus Thiosymbion ectosymbiont of Robbea hypermnestra]
MFRDVTTRNQVAITHLCVDKSVRGQGIADQLVASLRQLRTNSRGIGLWCRRDYDVMNLWPKLGFVAHRERPGRGRNGKELVFWWLDHGHSDLLNITDPERLEDVLVLALDANVFFDLEGQDRQEESESCGLLADWLQPQVELCVTPELLNEIERHSDANERNRLRARVTHYRMLNGDDTATRKLVKRLDGVLGSAKSTSQQSDRRQLAWAVVGDADHFVTRDGGLLEKSAEIYGVSGLSPLRPSELIIQVDALTQARDYQPTRLAGSHLYSGARVSGDMEGLTDTFLNNPAGERRSRLLAILRRFFANPKDNQLFVVSDTENAPVALLGLSKTIADELVIEIARVAGGRLAPTLARELLDIAVERARVSNRVFCRLADLYASDAVVMSSTAAGFRPVGNTRLKVSLPIIAPIVDIAEHLKGLTGFDVEGETIVGELASLLEQAHERQDMAALLAAERSLRPVKFTDLDVPTYIVPIDSVWAAALFDEQLASSELFTGRPELMFRGENAYYRANRPGRISAPGRILWYVKQAKNKPGTMAIRAVSYLDEVIVDLPKTLFRRFQRLGVYEWENVFELAKRDIRTQIMALVFSDTEQLNSPMPFGDVQETLVCFGMARNQLQSPLRIPRDCFIDIYARGCQ